MTRIILLLLVLLPPLPASAERAREVVDGVTLRLEDGRELRLAGIDAPRPPLADAARKVLEDLALGTELTLRQAGADRHGRLLAQASRSDGVWLQAELLRRGLARVHTTVDTRAEAAAMLALEASARAVGAGLWRRPEYRVRSPAEVGRDLDSFQIVEGRILAAGRGRDDVFLNFGADRRTDFTVRIPRAAQKLFREAGFDPLALQGERVRVRGWVRGWNGPLIDATHPEQVERLP